MAIKRGPVRTKGLTAIALAFTFAGIVTLAAQFALSQASPPSADARSSDIAFGARFYAESCSVCHGATGLGLAEAREAFPEDHRRCERCHRPGNPAVMSLAEIEARQHDLFDIGEPPALVGGDALAATVTPVALRAYLQAAMPRHRPGALSDSEYDALTAFLLDINGRRHP
jgi:mono/diheme cytochrome c family protein